MLCAPGSQGESMDLEQWVHQRVNQRMSCCAMPQCDSQCRVRLAHRANQWIGGNGYIKGWIGGALPCTVRCHRVIHSAVRTWLTGRINGSRTMGASKGESKDVMLRTVRYHRAVHSPDHAASTVRNKRPGRACESQGNSMGNTVVNQYRSTHKVNQWVCQAH